MLGFLAYGTLRPGCGNDVLWRNRAHVVADDVLVHGYRLVTNGAYPYAIPAVGETTMATLIVPDVQHYDGLMDRLDGLEGVPHHYNRLQATCVTEDGSEVVAWLYVPANPDRWSRLTPVFGNDWYADLMERAL